MVNWERMGLTVIITKLHLTFSFCRKRIPPQKTKCGLTQNGYYFILLKVLRNYLNSQ